MPCDFRIEPAYNIYFWNFDKPIITLNAKIDN